MDGFDYSVPHARNVDALKALASYYERRGVKTKMEIFPGTEDNNPPPEACLVVFKNVGDYVATNEEFTKAAREAADVLGGKANFEHSEGSGRWFIDMQFNTGEEGDRYYTTWTTTQYEFPGYPEGLLVIGAFLVF